MKDANDVLLEVGQSVNVAPDDGSPFFPSFSFVGTITDIRENTVIVEDQDFDSYELDPNKVTVI